MKLIRHYVNKYKNIRFYRSLINKGDLCFDIGANIGTKSKIFLSIPSKVIAFEPQSSCHPYLKKIKHKNFSFVPFAVGAENTRKTLNLANYSQIATLTDKFKKQFTFDPIQWEDTEIVTVKKIDTLIEEYGTPDFCKIDTEGYELDIISKLSYSIPTIEFEFTNGFVENTIKCIKLLEKKNTIYNYNLNEKPKFELKKWVTATEISAIVNSLPKKNLHGNIFVKNI